jgi:hypothetical protein
MHADLVVMVQRMSGGSWRLLTLLLLRASMAVLWTFGGAPARFVSSDAFG